ncbi:Lipase, GDSL [Artemisia annua]|uniref:Lipase, GDSL n=1 Tax=Artemisia annua TaxID=35608 RepID=A0A2U1MDT3_ARTAN|nr:Lipase, GDSL [Artemisia annua]
MHLYHHFVCAMLDEQEVTPIQEQLQQFQALIDQKHLHKNQIMKSLIFMASGSNDIFSYFLLPDASKLTPQQYVVTMLKQLSLFVDKTYKVGARKFVFFTIGPLGCIPGRVIIRGAPTDRCMGRMNLMAKQYNEGLELFIKSIPTKYPGAIGVYAVVYNTVQKFRANPKHYGFSDVSEACCGAGSLNGELQCGLKGYKMCSNPNEYFFWDSFHPTQRVYGLLSKIATIHLYAPRCFLMDLESANAHIKSLFIFGDSIFDPSNNHFVKNCTIQGNFTPYGSSYFLHPTGRFTNGRTIADFIEVYHELAKDSRNGFPANGVNFASGGSGLLNDTNKDVVR